MNKFILYGIIFLFTFSQITISTGFAEQDNYIKTANQSDQSTWTLLFYLAADNPRSYEIEKNIDLWTSIGYSDNINMISLIDGMKTDDTIYCEISNQSINELYWPESESDMGNKNTLERFLNHSLTQFPAEHYALFIMSTHGSGWQGLGSDTSGINSYEKLTLLNLNDYSSALEKIYQEFNDKIDVIAFDICVTGMIEVAYQIKDHCTFMIGTEEHGFSELAESDEGVNLEWNYSYFLTNIIENPDMKPEEFVNSIVDSYTPGTYSFKLFDRYPAPSWMPLLKCYSTISSVNLTRFDTVINSINTFSLLLANNIDEYKTSIDQARQEVREYGKLYKKFWFLPSKIYYLHLDSLGYNCFIDLYDFIQKISIYTNDDLLRSSCNDVMESLTYLISGNNVLESDNSHGLSIYFPEYSFQYDVSIWKSIGLKNMKEIPVHYNEISFSIETNWDEFLSKYYQ